MATEVNSVAERLGMSDARYERLKCFGVSDDALLYCTDKVSHGYMPFYRALSHSLTAKAVCEIGVLNGGSLAMLQDLFPHAAIVGVDNSTVATWPTGTRKIVSDQTAEDLPKRLGEIANVYDLIIDDASHIAVFTRITWEMLWPLVAPGGYYVIEDWQVGFPGHLWHAELGAGWLGLAAEFLSLLDEPKRLGIESVEYRYGLIILRRAECE